MNELKVIFDATFVNEDYVQNHVERINKDLFHLQKVFPFDFDVDTYPVLDSELEISSGIPSIHLRVRVHSHPNQDRNYHNIAMIFQGYFGLFASLPDLHSGLFQIQ